MATRLFIKSNGTGRPRYKIWIDRDGVQRDKLAGFSFYGEVNGLRTRRVSKFAELMPDTDPPSEDWRTPLSHDASTNMIPRPTVSFVSTTACHTSTAGPSAI